jgi:hypothetical protein
MIIPIATDEFARALAAGYVAGDGKGGAMKAGFQEASPLLLAFAGPVPSWALPTDAVGHTVFLTVDMAGLSVSQVASGCFVVPTFLRTERIKEAIFPEQDHLENFKATYAQFPDIPMGTMAFRVSQVETVSADQPSNLPSALRGVTVDGPTYGVLDAACGWASILVLQLLEGKLDEEVAGSLSAVDGKKSWRELAELSLASYDRRCTEFDKAIWGAIVEAAIDHRSERGFDRRVLLDDARGRLGDDIREHAEVAKWFAYTRDVLEARRDPPLLNDEGSIGRRAALVILLAHDLSSVEAFKCGLRVASLAKLFVGAFKGISRLGAEFKNDMRRLGAAQEIGERIASGKASSIDYSAKTYDEDLSVLDTVLHDGKPLIQRRAEPSPHLMLLRARVLEAGLRISVDDSTGRLRIISEHKDAIRIFVEDNPIHQKTHPVVRFWTPIRKMTSRLPSSIDLRALLGLSWRTGCAIGTYEVDGQPMLCAYVVLLTNTLDREEFEFHVETLQTFVAKANAL